MAWLATRGECAALRCERGVLRNIQANRSVLFRLPKSISLSHKQLGDTRWDDNFSLRTRIFFACRWLAGIETLCDTLTLVRGKRVCWPKSPAADPRSVQVVTLSFLIRLTFQLLSELIDMLNKFVRTLFTVSLAVIFCWPAIAQDGSAGDSHRSFAGAFFVSQGQDGSLEILGSLIIWFLLILSLVSIGLIGYMTLTNQRKAIIPDGVVDAVRELFKAGDFKEAIKLTDQEESYFSHVLRAGLVEAGNGYSAMIRGLELASDEETTQRLRKIEYLNVLGQVSPMIGLFGTVYGMILAFQAIVISGGEADPIALAGGIGTALTTTFWGLVVAIPALAGYAIVRNRIDALTTEATHTAEQLINQFRPKAARTVANPQPKPKS